MGSIERGVSVHMLRRMLSSALANDIGRALLEVFCVLRISGHIVHGDRAIQGRGYAWMVDMGGANDVHTAGIHGGGHLRARVAHRDGLLSRV